MMIIIIASIERHDQGLNSKNNIEGTIKAHRRLKQPPAMYINKHEPRHSDTCRPHSNNKVLSIFIHSTTFKLDGTWCVAKSYCSHDVSLDRRSFRINLPTTTGSNCNIINYRLTLHIFLIIVTITRLERLFDFLRLAAAQMTNGMQ
jgi:hypothetical protein